ncbi:MAG: prepilin-type N-terminal cleavage/methylation domain-containing protein, partial [Planctomycetaceae bacterium]|nr:prepilin-type N-terminal cleavage/methylation domain-containing protein [Planctomycetaceae bacterium]
MKYSPRHHLPERSQTGNRPVEQCESRGFTLLELILALSITALVVVSLSGLLLAVQNAWSVSRNYHDVGLQGRAILDRINWMVAQAGTYRINGGPVHLGLSV